MCTFFFNLPLSLLHSAVALICSVYAPRASTAKANLDAGDSTTSTVVNAHTLRADNGPLGVKGAYCWRELCFFARDSVSRCFTGIVANVPLLGFKYAPLLFFLLQTKKKESKNKGGLRIAS